MQEEAKAAIDVVAVTTTVSTLMGWIPAVAAALSIIWTGIRIFEIDTVKGWFNARD